MSEHNARQLLRALAELDDTRTERDLLLAEGRDRFDAWFFMRDEFECTRTLPGDRILKIMDSYETEEMAKYRKLRDSGRQSDE